MAQQKFQSTLAWAASKGLYLNDSLERRSINGVSGMYATTAIQKDTLLATFPFSELISTNDKLYPQGTSNSARQIHASALEYQRKGKSHFEPLFLPYDDLDAIKSYSTYFSNEKELKVLKEVGVGVYKEIVKQNTQNNMLIRALFEFDKSIDIDTYTLMALNYGSRAMGTNGFVPILDCFNHSDEKGMFIDGDDDNVILKMKIDCDEGDQVFISYGLLDMYSHAINYNYFDSNNQHFIQFGKRFNFPIITQNDRHFANQLSKMYSIKLEKMNGLMAYSINDMNAYFGESGPSKKLIEIVKVLCLKECGKEQESEVYSSRLKHKILQLLAKLDEQNNVDKFGAKYVPRRLRRFYALLQKEKQIIGINREWVQKNL